MLPTTKDFAIYSLPNSKHESQRKQNNILEMVREHSINWNVRMYVSHSVMSDSL